MKTTKIKTAELTGKALDWAVGVAVGEAHDVTPEGFIKCHNFRFWRPTKNWYQCGPFLDKMGWEYGPDIETACRAIVSARLGETVDVPEVLV